MLQFNSVAQRAQLLPVGCSSGPKVCLCFVQLHAPAGEKLLHNAPSPNSGAHIVAEELEVVHIQTWDGLGGEDALVNVPDPVDHRHGNDRQTAALGHASVGADKIADVALHGKEALRAVEVTHQEARLEAPDDELLGRRVLKCFDQIGHTSNERLGLLQSAFNQGLAQCQRSPALRPGRKPRMPSGRTVPSFLIPPLLHHRSGFVRVVARSYVATCT